MTNCTHILAMMDDYLDQHLDDVESGLIHRHLARCPDCEARFREAQAVYQAVRTWPSEQECEVAARQVLSRAMAAATGPEAAASPLSLWRPLVAAASLAMMFVIGGFLMPWGASDADHKYAITLYINDPQPVQLALEANTDLERVTLTLELPDHVTLAGYPAEKLISWDASLRAGTNRLSLPLQANTEGKGDLRLTVLSENGFRNTRIIRLHGKEKGLSVRRALPANQHRTI
jgi:hypothetical protein